MIWKKVKIMPALQAVFVCEQCGRKLYKLTDTARCLCNDLETELFKWITKLYQEYREAWRKYYGHE